MITTQRNTDRPIPRTMAQTDYVVCERNQRTWDLKPDGGPTGLRTERRPLGLRPGRCRYDLTVYA